MEGGCRLAPIVVWFVLEISKLRGWKGGMWKAEEAAYTALWKCSKAQRLKKHVWTGKMMRGIAETHRDTELRD